MDLRTPCGPFREPPVIPGGDSRTGPLPAPLMLGHRGLGRGVVATHRENTLGSFLAAVALGTPWVEADVRRTRDDVLVVAHDPVLPDGTLVGERSAGHADRAGLLRLDRLLEQLPHEVGLNLDVKSCITDGRRPPDRTTAALLAPVAAAESAQRSVLVSCFDPSALLVLRRQAPGVALAWLTWHHFPLEAAVAGCAHLDVEVLGLHVGSLGWDAGADAVDAAVAARTVSLVHECGRQLLVWCPGARAARAVLDEGADAVVVDDVPTTLPALARAS